MKKIISILCSLAVLAGFAIPTMAEGENFTFDLVYMDKDYNVKDAADLQAGDLVDIFVKVNNVSDLTNIGTAVEDFSGIIMQFDYDADTFQVSADGTGLFDESAESTAKTAIYSGKKKVIPTEDNGGFWTTGAMSITPNLSTNGHIVYLVQEPTSFFSMWGTIFCLELEVKDTAGTPDVAFSIDQFDYKDISHVNIDALTIAPIAVDGIGAAPVEEITFSAPETQSKDTVNGKHTTAMKTSVTIPASKVGKISKINVPVTSTVDGDATVSYDVENVLDLSNFTFGLNITRIPAEAVVTFGAPVAVEAE